MKNYCFLFCFLFFLKVSAQEEITVTGEITDAATNMPIGGATIVEKGTKNGAMANFDGVFSIKVPKEAILEISFLGFASSEVVVNGRSNINIQLEQQASELDEVVVVGYGTAKKSDLTGSVISIKSEEILETKSPNFMDALQGRMSGVQISSGSGAPGSEVDIRIRGAVSINAGTKPLYVIDGVQFDPNEQVVASSGVVGDDSQSPLAFINPEDIESIEVLKDASATAIFGSRGSNGVVMITTKGATSGNRMSLSVYTSVSTIPSDRLINMANTVEFGEWYRSFSSPGDDSNNFFWEADGTARDLTNEATRNWQEELIKPAATQNYSLTFSSAGERGDIAGSISYADQNGVISNTDFERLTGRLQGSSQLNNKIEVGGRMLYANSLANGVSEGGTQGKGAGAIKSIVLYRPIDPSSFQEDDIVFDDSEHIFSSPGDYVLLSERENTNSNFVSSFYIDYEFFKGLNFKSTIGGKVSNSKLKEYYPRVLNQSGRIGLGEINHVKSNRIFTENILTFEKTFNKNNRMNATLVFEVRKSNIESFSATNSNFEYEGLGANDLGAGSFPSPPSSQSNTVTNVGSLARVNYFLNGGTYIFTGSLRADASSKFHPDNQWGYFPSAAFGWRIDKYKFFRNQKVLSKMKFRTSFGVTGNDRLRPFQYSSYYTSRATISDNKLITAYKPAVLGNKDLRWETSTQYDLGLDVGLFNNRLSFTADYYYRITDDMLDLAVVPSTTGFAEKWRNIGRIDNKGYEFSLDANIASTTDFSWNSNFNISFEEATIKSLGEVDYINILAGGAGEQVKGRLEVGGEVGAFYGYEFGGIFQYEDFEEFQGMTTEEAAAIFDPSQSYTVVTDDQGDPVHPVHNSQGGQRPGDMFFVDQNEDYQVDEVNDKKIIGTSNPDFYGGFSNSLRFKNFSFNTNFTFSVGNEIFNQTKPYLEGIRGGGINISKEYFDNAWRPLSPSLTKPSFIGYGRENNSTYYIEDGSYLRLQKISIGYTFSENIVNKLRVNNLKIYVNANNVYTWTNYSGYTPDFNGPSMLPGLDRFNYPNPLTVTGGINIEF